MKPYSFGRQFTLIEVMIAIAIIGTTLVSLLTIRNRAIEDIATINDSRILRLLAEKKIAEIEIGVEENDSGDFSDEGYPEFSWEVLKEIIEITEGAGVNESSEEEEIPLEGEESEEEPATHSLNRIQLMIQFGFESRYELVSYIPLTEEEEEDQDE